MAFLDSLARAARRPEADRLILPACAALYAVSVWLRMRPWIPTEDETEYLTLAFNLFHHHVFSAARDGDTLAALTIAREPAYPAFLALLMTFDPRLARDALPCVVAGGGPVCDGLLASVEAANAILLGIAALCAALAARALTGWRAAGYIALGYVVLSGRITTLREQAMSDIFALATAAVFSVLAALAGRRRNLGAFAGAGLALAALALTKALFAPFAALAAAATLVVAARRRERRLALGALAAAVCFAAPTGAWIARNHALFDQARISAGREGPVLSLRREINSMTGGEYLAAWLYWTAGFGDDLARRFLPAALVARFDDDAADGFYRRAATRFGDDVAATREAGLSERAATERATAAAAREIAFDPMTYATMPLLVYRGIWMDRLAWLGAPLFVLALGAALRRGDGAAVGVLSLGVYSLLAAAAVTHAVPRFQCPAIAALAIGAAYAVAALRRAPAS